LKIVIEVYARLENAVKFFHRLRRLH
jgi:hypothetical protein